MENKLEPATIFIGNKSNDSVLWRKVGEALRALAVPEQLLDIDGFDVLGGGQERNAALAIERELARENALSVRVHGVRQPLLRRKP